MPTPTDRYGAEIAVTTRGSALPNEALDVGTLLAAGVALAEPTTVEIDGQTVGLAALMPDGYKLTVDTRSFADAREVEEQRAEAPRRTTGHVRVRDLPSWTAYVLRHGANTTEVFADQQKPAVTALLNAPGRDTTGWADHRATLVLEHSEDWKAWADANGRWHSQADFAELIEARQPTIVEPDAASMLELAQTFEATKGVQFKQSTLLQNGRRQLTFIETVEGKAGERGQIEIPKTLLLQVMPWRGVPVAVEVTARFRYRIDDGKLRLGVILDRVDEVLDQAWARFTDSVSESLNAPETEGGAAKGFPVLQGPAPTYSGRTV